MRSRQVFSLASIIGLALGFSVLVGCSGGEPEVQTSDQDNLLLISAAYGEATNALKRPPENVEELKKFLPAESRESSLISPVDNQPYVIIWGVDMFKNYSSPIVIGYEKEGKDGTRQVFTSITVMPMTEEEFANANFPKGHRPE